MAKWSQLPFQDAASPLMSQLIFLHDHIMLVLTLVLTFVGIGLWSLFKNSYLTHIYTEAQQVEIVWTSFPAIILLCLAFPSLRLLYLMDEIAQPSLTLKVVGHQWYWSYEYSDLNNLSFDSYMTPATDLFQGQGRLLEVDNRTILPTNNEIRTLISSSDVIHAWTTPALSIKMDAVPGRLNQTSLYIFKPGLYYGQCSEICGANHSFMPICIEALPPMDFFNWVNQN